MAFPSRDPSSRPLGGKTTPQLRASSPGSFSVISDLSHDTLVSERELTLLAVLLGDRLTAILEDNS